MEPEQLLQKVLELCETICLQTKPQCATLDWQRWLARFSSHPDKSRSNTLQKVLFKFTVFHLQDSKMMTSWEVGVEEPALETGGRRVPPWGAVALGASEMGLPSVALPWTSESPQKVNSCCVCLALPPQRRLLVLLSVKAPALPRQISQVECFSFQRSEHSDPGSSSNPEQSILPSIK